MTYMLIPLALLGLIGGVFNIPANLGNGLLDSFLASLNAEGSHLTSITELSLQGAASLVALGGFFTAWLRYGGKHREERISQADREPGPLVSFLRAGWYFDRLYRFLFIRPFEWLSAVLWERVDEGVIDDNLDRMANLLGRTGHVLGGLGNGRVSAYLLCMAAGAALIIAWFAWVMP